ncbi:MAG: hypothetical protein J5727_00025 [Kiritimatiellae bacterium]|nr:hypothetical protein [Kiritimatiellia bacterium]
MSKCWYGMLMVCALFVAAAQLPAVAEEAGCGAVPDRSEEAALRQVFVDSITAGVIKGLQVTGKEVPPERQAKLRAIADESFSKILARVKAAGHYEDYRKQMFDPEIRQLDKKVLEAKTAQEILPIAQQQVKIFSEKYPELFRFISSDQEMQAATMEMMQKLFEVCK